MAKKEEKKPVVQSPKFVLNRNVKNEEGEDVKIENYEAMTIAQTEAEKRGFNKISMQQGNDESFEFLFYSR